MGRPNVSAEAGALGQAHVRTMNWPDHAIWWQVYPLGFTGTYPGGPAGAAHSSASDAAPARAARGSRGLDRLLPWLDYAVELGCSGLSLGPIFESSTHGYDTIDYFRIDSRLGGDAAFDRLVAAAKERGLRVLLDGVFNHVGRSFPTLARAITDGPDSAAAAWFRAVRDQGAAGADPGTSGPIGFATFEGHDDLVVLNHSSPAVADFVVEVMCDWLDRGADGWRLDAAYAVPAEFWQPVLTRVRAVHLDAWFVGEMIHGDYATYVAESTLDSVTQYELWKAIWSSLNDANFFELAWSLERHERYAEHFLPMTFLGNHDVTRIASQLADPATLGHAMAILFSVAGSPSIYSGDEQGFRGVKEERFGGDDAIRPAFPTGPDALAPWGWPTYQLTERFIALRRREPWLAHCRTTVEALTNSAIALRSRPRDGGRRELVTLLNLGDQPHEFAFDLTGLKPELSSWGGTEATISTTVPARGWVVATAAP